MAEYIERKRARHELTLFFGYDTDVAEDCDSLLCMLPAANVAPVVHGEWSVKYPLRECGCCGEIYTELGGNDGKSWNYCPNCGAKMDGGTHETD